MTTKIKILDQELITQAKSSSFILNNKTQSSSQSKVKQNEIQGVQ